MVLGRRLLRNGSMWIQYCSLRKSQVKIGHFHLMDPKDWRSRLSAAGVADLLKFCSCVTDLRREKEFLRNCEKMCGMRVCKRHIISRREGSNRLGVVNWGKITDSGKKKKKIVFVLQESTCEDSDDSTLRARVLIMVACSLLLNCAAFVCNDSEWWMNAWLCPWLNTVGDIFIGVFGTPGFYDYFSSLLWTFHFSKSYLNITKMQNAPQLAFNQWKHSGGTAKPHLRMCSGTKDF